MGQQMSGIVAAAAKMMLKKVLTEMTTEEMVVDVTTIESMAIEVGVIKTVVVQVTDGDVVSAHGQSNGNNSQDGCSPRTTGLIGDEKGSSH